jgi:Zn-dependent M28 family amino/carboxypeptidase
MRIKHVQRGALFCLLLSSATMARAQQASQFHDRIAAIAAGSDIAARRQAITVNLKSLGIEYLLDEFTVTRFSGTNIVAEIAGTKPTKMLLLGAHYDRIAQGNGAVDNAASCAVLLGLLAKFKSNPLEAYTIRAVFFDLEEGGLVGSQAYFAKTRGAGLPELALNLDIFGYGDTLFATASSQDGQLAKALEQASKEGSVALRWMPRNQYPASDHRIMMTAGIETVGLALIDGKEIDAIGQRGGTEPRILTIIHTPEDTIDKIHADDIEKAFPVLENLIRFVDKQ